MMTNERIGTQGRENMGRTTIDDARRKKFSHRAANGNLDVVMRRCVRCGHHKAFVNNTDIKCTKCRHVVAK